MWTYQRPRPLANAVAAVWQGEAWDCKDCLVNFGTSRVAHRPQGAVFSNSIMKSTEVLLPSAQCTMILCKNRYPKHLSTAEKSVCGTNNHVKSEMLSNTQTDRQTDRQTRRPSPRCACAPRVTAACGKFTDFSILDLHDTPACWGG